jgi:polysaccharide export outer membrane protein
MLSCLIFIATAVALLGTPGLAQQSCTAAGCLDTVRETASGTVPLRRPTTADEKRETTPDAQYRLRAGDVVDLNFPFVPAFNQTLTVQPDGYLTLHALGPLRVDGLTVPELTETLRTKYLSMLRDPVITVALKDFEKPYFIVAGEVERPGKYDLRGETTVSQAVAIAGGLKARAKHSNAVVFRRLSAGGFETKTLDLKKMLNDAQLGADVRLASGDMLFIPSVWRLDSSLRIADVISSLWIVGWFF